MLSTENKVCSSNMDGRKNCFWYAGFPPGPENECNEDDAEDEDGDDGEEDPDERSDCGHPRLQAALPAGGQHQLLSNLLGQPLGPEQHLLDNRQKVIQATDSVCLLLCPRCLPSHSGRTRQP